MIYTLLDNSLKFFQSYLNDRTQVLFDRKLYDSGNVQTSVPQGSIRGPHSFTLFVNDLFLTPKEFNLRMFADDSTIYTDDDSIDEIILKFNGDLEYFHNWYDQSKMSIHLYKSKEWALLLIRNSVINL